MRAYNLIAVYSADRRKLLMCKRLKQPYLGLYNFVGGKIEPGEDGLDAAYRELWEETSLTREDVVLTHLLDMRYYVTDCLLEVYVGRVGGEVEVRGEENELHWVELEGENFFDMAKFAGAGNIGHILEEVKYALEVDSELLK